MSLIRHSTLCTVINDIENCSPIAAIKDLRINTGLSLKMAKDVVDGARTAGRMHGDVGNGSVKVWRAMYDEAISLLAAHRITVEGDENFNDIMIPEGTPPQDAYGLGAMLGVLTQMLAAQKDTNELLKDLLEQLDR